jgi:hypothetical protein
MAALDAVNSILWASSYVNPLMLVGLWTKLLPDLDDDDLQGFLIKKSASLEFLTWCAL